MFSHALLMCRARRSLAVTAALLPLVVTLAACSDTTPTAPATPGTSAPSHGKNVTGSNQRILFESFRDGNIEVYSMRPDGTDVTRVTNDAAFDHSAVWSPDGKRIAFASGRDTRLGEIYTMNADGTDVVRLTNGPGGNDQPSWSKDGSQLVFVSTRDAADPAAFRAEDLELYVMNVDGSNVVRLTDDAASDAEPAFSADGRQIAFTSTRDNEGTTHTDLYVMDRDGTNLSRLTFAKGTVLYPSWDPHSRRLAFSIVSTETANGIYTMNLDDRGFTRLTFSPTDLDEFPSWSTDGSQLAFSSRRDGNREIYVMNADGTQQTRLTVNPATDAFPRWSR